MYYLIAIFWIFMSSYYLYTIQTLNGKFSLVSIFIMIIFGPIFLLLRLITKNLKINLGVYWI